jgi:hypothetical protein
MTKTETKTWYFARIPIPSASPVKIKEFLLSLFLLSQMKKKNKVAVKKKINIVSSIVTLESQKNPGITPNNTLDIKAVFESYVRLANLNVIQIENKEKITAVSLPEAALTPKT